MACNLLFTYTSQGKSAVSVVINTETGLARQIPLPVAFPAKAAVPSGGFLYLGAANTLSRYNLQTGALTTLGTVGDTTLYTGCAAPDGALFFGSHPNGRVLGYNPAIGTLTDYGRMDVNGPVQYAYSIVADATHVYVGLGQSPWYLGVLNRATGEKTIYYKDDNGPSRQVERAVNGTLWYGLVNAVQLVDGALVTGQTQPAMIPGNERTGANIEPSTWAARTGYEVNLDDAVPLTGVPASIRWRAVGGENWSEHQPSGLPLQPQVIRRTYPYDETRLLCLSGDYGPAYLYTPASKAVEVLGLPQRSLYDAVRIGDKWYLSGYPAATYEYDPALLWTLTDSSADHSDTNPRAVLAVDKYHHYSAVGSDGRLYVAATHERDSVGGEFGWYDPATEQSGTLRDPLARWHPRALAAVGDKIVFSATSLDGFAPRLFVFDVSDPATVEREITPLADLPGLDEGYILRVSDTDVMGLCDTAAFRQNVVTGAQVWRVVLPGDAMRIMPSVDQRVEIAPDGLAYFYIGEAIYAIDPDDGAFERRVTNGGTQGAVTWHGGTAYVYGTTELRRIKFA